MMRNKIKNILPEEILKILRFIRAECECHTIRKSGRRFFRESLNKENAIKLELGSGAKRGRNGWITVDFDSGCDIRWNLLEPLPIPENSVDRVYCSHVLEHFFYPDLIKLIKEVQRILKNGGSFSVCVPNAELYVKAYLSPIGLNEFESKFYKPAFFYHTPIDYLNYMAYMDGGHRHMFDLKNLLEILRYCGFSKVSSRPFDHELDLQGRDHESIYVLAIK
jgi:predicted SAM-dependent methyltransferase